MMPDGRSVHVKTGAARQIAAEASGLRWLAAAGGCPIVEVLDEQPGRLVEPLLIPTTATPAHAADFGRGLARLHRAGAAWQMCGPPGWHGDGYIGLAEMPLAPVDHGLGWAKAYARYRLRPYLRALSVGSSAGGSGLAALERLADRLDGDDGTLAGPPVAVARLHGDLWNGNVVWTAGGAVLIDPAAHGGHPETDLAMLALFGAPQLPSILAGYQEISALPEGWRDRTGLHQVYPLLVHAVLFSGGYLRQALDAAARYA